MEQNKTDVREERVDLRIPLPVADVEEWRRQTQLVFKLNHTMPRTEEYDGILKE